MLADSGYACQKQVDSVQGDGIEVYVATGAERKNQRRKYDFRPKSRRRETRKEPKAEWLIEMSQKLQTEEGRRLYRLRKQTVEPVFGIIKQGMGFRQFLLRGFEKSQRRMGIGHTRLQHEKALELETSPNINLWDWSARSQSSKSRTTTLWKHP